MAILKAVDRIDEYRKYALHKKIHWLSGRKDNSALTSQVNKQICKRLCFCPEDIVLDLGCGDGSLLNQISCNIKYGVGISPTDEEVRVLKSNIIKENVEFKKGLADAIPFDDGSFTKIICNGVLLLLPTPESIDNSIKEIARVTKKGGSIYLGELLQKNELNTRRDLPLYLRLFNLLRKKGIFIFLRSGMRIVKTVFKKNDVYVIKSSKLLITPKEIVVKFAENNGLELVDFFKHEQIDKKGKIYHSKTRIDLLLIKK